MTQTPDDKKPNGKVTEEQKERQCAEAKARNFEQAKAIIGWYKLGAGAPLKGDETEELLMAEYMQLKMASRRHSAIELGERIAGAMAEFVNMPIPDDMAVAYMLGILYNFQSVTTTAHIVIFEQFMANAIKATQPMRANDGEKYRRPDHTMDAVEQAMKERQKEHEAHNPTPQTVFQRLGGDELTMNNDGEMVCKKCGSNDKLQMSNGKIKCISCD